MEATPVAQRPTRWKLYVWKDVLTDYSSGLMVAVARNTAEARELLLKDCSYIPPEDLAKEPEVHNLNEPYAVHVWGGG